MERHLTGPSQRVQGKSPQQSGVTNPNFKAQSVSLYRPSHRRVVLLIAQRMRRRSTPRLRLRRRRTAEFESAKPRIHPAEFYGGDEDDSALQSGCWQMQLAGSQRCDEGALFLPIVGKRIMQEVA